jgi:SAM-dependent methyltransferase
MQRIGPVHRHIQDDLVRVVSGLDVRSILDVGCGSGENLARLAVPNRYELCGTDVSDEALALARRNARSARLLQLNIEREALPERFELVMSIQVVEHLLDDLAALRNIASMSSKYVFTSTVGGRMRPSERSIGHVRNYSPVELRRKHELAGLEVLWVRGWDSRSIRRSIGRPRNGSRAVPRRDRSGGSEGSERARCTTCIG